MHGITRAATLVLTVGIAGALSAQQPPLKIAYVSTQALLDNAPGRADAEATFQKEAETYRTQLKQMSDSINAMIAKYQKEEPTLTAAQKDTRSKSIRTLEEAFQGKQQSLTQEAQRRQNELMTPIMEQVKKVLDDVRTEDGYSLIIAADPSLILSADKNLDITDRVIARLKTIAAIKGAPAAKPGAPISSPSGVARPKPPTR